MWLLRISDFEGLRLEVLIVSSVSSKRHRNIGAGSLLCLWLDVTDHTECVLCGL